jgi:hypothetical protein
VRVLILLRKIRKNYYDWKSLKGRTKDYRCNFFLWEINYFFLKKNNEGGIRGEHKLSVSFTKVNTVNLFLTPHVLYIADDHFILSRISMLGTNYVSIDSLDE